MLDKLRTKVVTYCLRDVPRAIDMVCFLIYNPLQLGDWIDNVILGYVGYEYDNLPKIGDRSSVQVVDN